MDYLDYEALLESAFDTSDCILTPQPAGVEKQYINDALSALTPGGSSVESDLDTIAESDHGHSLIDPSDTLVVSLSTTFHPAADLLHTPCDLILSSSDDVFFYVHTSQLLSVSSNRFDNMIPTEPVHSSKAQSPAVRVPESANVLNVILHTAYNIPCAHYTPTLDTLIAAIDAMPSYGLSPKMHVSTARPLYTLLLNQAPVQPLAVYALAARHDLYELAKPVSSHLLSVSIEDISDHAASQIGPIYLKRLCTLQATRLDTLKRILLPPPHPHPATDKCDLKAWKGLTRAWGLASAYLAWYARPDMSPGTIQSALAPLADRLPCHLCKQSLQDRIRNLLGQWSSVHRTI